MVEKFMDRVRKNPNKRKIEIISQNSNIMEVNILEADGNIEQGNEGTPITADIMNEFKAEYDLAKNMGARVSVLESNVGKIEYDQITDTFII